MLFLLEGKLSQLGQFDKNVENIFIIRTPP
jgi:hypothetical protein